ncbi:MAG: S41 family peptidase [Bacteroidales bacterium]|nr:S41 family peptidase [Bacteroidales bacterium]
MKTKLALFCLLSLLFFSCKKDDSEIITPQTQPHFSDIAKDYLNEVLNIMEKNSIYRFKIDWGFLRYETFNAVSGANTIEHTYSCIRRALTLIGDNHSSYRTSNGITFMGNSSITIRIESIATPEIPNDIGYVRVASFSGLSNDATAIDFAYQIQGQMKQQDHWGIKGWIVDLRNNTGGNMWPMLAGIGPILGEGVAGYFSYPDGRDISWGFKDGASVQNETYVITLLRDSYNLLVPNPRVAVLLNSAVASSGEIIAVSFIGRENTKSFGSPTSGLSTSNQSFVLSDRAILNLTTAYQADRNKRKYGVPINPDQMSKSTTIINDAISWIRDL